MNTACPHVELPETPIHLLSSTGALAASSRGTILPGTL